MSKKVPDAWDDDDFGEVADSQNPVNATATGNQSAPAPRVSRAERKARHIEANKALWNSAENPEAFHYVDTRNDVPLRNEFKPALTVLSRKPQPTTSNNEGTTTGLENGVSQIVLQRSGAGASTSVDQRSTAPDGGEETDSEEEERRVQQREFEKRQARAKLEREEKQRRYQEVRERLFGPNPAEPATTSPSTAQRNGGVEPTRSQAQTPRGGRGHRRGGSSSGARGGKTNSPSRASQSNAGATATPSKQLFDPDYSAKPGSSAAQMQNPRRTAAEQSPARSATAAESQHVRAPRGPDAKGSGFAARGRGANG